MLAESADGPIAGPGQRDGEVSPGSQNVHLRRARNRLGPWLPIWTIQWTDPVLCHVCGLWGLCSLEAVPDNACLLPWRMGGLFPDTRPDIPKFDPNRHHKREHPQPDPFLLAHGLRSAQVYLRLGDLQTP